MTYKHRELRYEASFGGDTWGPMGSMTTVMMSIGYLSWWTASLIFGPIWLAVRRQEHAMVDERWASGDAL